ncbi:MAG: hypothetical protein ACT4NX_06085 [Deltaproteobacteria bacterium]
MKKIKSTLTLIILIIAAAGCGDIKTTSYFDEPKVALGNYIAIEITDFESDLQNVGDALLKDVPDEVSRLINSGRSGLRAKRAAIEDVPAERVLVLLGEVVEADSGSNLKLEGGAIKFGESSLTIQLAIVEKQTGDEITTGQVNSSSSLGFFRRGFVAKETYEALAEEIASFVSANYRKK